MPTLETSKIQMLLALRRQEGSLFSSMPSEIIGKISGYSFEDNRHDYEVGLHYIVNEQLKELKDLLDAKPFLVLFDGKGSSVITPRGTSLIDHSFYICAIQERDPDIKAYIESIFLQVKGGEEVMLTQFKTIQTLPCEQSNDLSWLFDVIVDSPMDDVAAELKTGEEYNWDYCSPSRQGYWGSDLREALNKFREKELARTCRTLNSSDMHDDDQRIDQVYTLLAQYEDKLIVGNNYNKLRLACRQILGLRQLLNCSGYDRIVFASEQIDQTINGEEINRDSGYNYKYPTKVLGTGSPALAWTVSMRILVWVSISLLVYTQRHSGAVLARWQFGRPISKFISNKKTASLQRNPMQQSPVHNQTGCVMF